ncbi:GDSL-type esterase/lipase family protein [Pedobacter xixiisoli]|uniref:Lysophospholipase L1 n=1 Tax=Pedobacter xixiisoli TaxID=1476464 RepID=A0A285ZRN7_9SPHI|nr:GDSL-type esterase/lipase family protein [Pedobacter xixiisoli]SOD12326.1 Lysophospholipase L1 [Pedobacter xixiisoli]
MIVKNRFIVIVLASLLWFGKADAQTKPYDSTYRPGKYKELVQKFNAEPITKKEYVFLGNSITAGTDWSKLLNLPQAKNRGISGDITYGVLERLQEVIDRKPAKVFVLIGINDISRNIPDSLILQNYKTIIERIRKGSKKTQIYFYTMLPVNASFEKFKNHYGKDEHILYLNDEIRKFKAKKVDVIDLYPHFLDGDKKLRAELTKDGLHLIPAGYEVWAKVLNEGGYLK